MRVAKREPVPKSPPLQTQKDNEKFFLPYSHLKTTSTLYKTNPNPIPIPMSLPILTHFCFVCLLVFFPLSFLSFLFRKCLVKTPTPPSPFPPANLSETSSPFLFSTFFFSHFPLAVMGGLVLQFSLICSQKGGQVFGWA